MKLMLLLVLAVWCVTAIYGQRLCLTEGDVQIFTETSSFFGVSNAGRVEICLNGVWGTIATDSIATPWSEKNAQVACIQAGFVGGVLNVIRQNTIPLRERSQSLQSLPIHLSGVQCDGTELDIMSCRNSSIIPPDITHQLDAYVVCRPQTIEYSDVHPAGPQTGDIRLFGDPRNGYGAVEIYSITAGWRGICPDFTWTDSDASTICQDLGYASGSIIEPIFVSSSFRTTVQLYSPSCPPSSGDPLTLGVCSFQTSTSSNVCTSNRFAALRCNNVSERSVRLLGGENSREGIVEIAYNGRWGMVCDDSFSSTDARSVCEGLGFNRDDASMMSLTSASPILESESNLKPIWLTELSCSSSDSSLLSCIDEDNIIGFADCRSFDIAAVDCGDPSGPLSTSQIIGIVIGILAGIFVIGIFGWIYGKPYWEKRHNYGWYNTLTTPSDWFDCDCFSSSNTRQSNDSSVFTTGYVRSGTQPASNTTTTFNLTRRTSLDREPQPEPEPEPDPEAEPSDPGLSKVPPPSYQAASNFPTHDLKPDLPPPYPGGPGPSPSAPSTAATVAYPAPTAPGYPQSEATAPPDPAYPPPPTAAPGYPQTGVAPDAGAGYPPSWTSPAYPPPSGSSELPYPSDNPPYPS